MISVFCFAVTMSPVNMALPMFTPSIKSRWALMAARGWARLILARRRDWINDRPYCATAAEAPRDKARERYHFDNPMTHTRGAHQQGEAAKRTCFALYFFAYDLVRCYILAWFDCFRLPGYIEKRSSAAAMAATAPSPGLPF